ncbi:helix-turn-helix transcriptional regulator [Frondihabitans australicus]|uniref:AraC-like DNA-binding protein n=1 Tax=Frondihabitans australicus TaxID=386892 RepID=A0A495ICX3_9MICO|nr:helix-turn-helix transcriptional regulator [Frondihabitans australicus]RKR73308.1 AraC-like DNA-binding protein [Frondihabitans australicus]
MGAPVSFAVQTNQADEAAEAIREGFGYRVAISAGELSYRQSVLVGDDVASAQLHLGAHLKLDLAPTDELMFVQLLSGTYRYDPWGVERELGAGASFLMPPGQQMSFEIDHADAATCAFSARTFADIARDVFDLDDFTLTEGVFAPGDPAKNWLWHRAADTYRASTLGDPAVYDSDLLVAESTRQLVVSAIVTFGLFEVPERTADGSAAVRRAMLYADERLRSPLTVEDLASAARLSSRGLTLAFQRERGQTPMQYVRDGRLAGARADLIAADPTRGETVTTIAGSWGFSNAGRFAARYAEVYGESPRATLAG